MGWRLVSATSRRFHPFQLIYKMLVWAVPIAVVWLPLTLFAVRDPNVLIESFFLIPLYELYVGFISTLVAGVLYAYASFRRRRDTPSLNPSPLAPPPAAWPSAIGFLIGVAWIVLLSAVIIWQLYAMFQEMAITKEFDSEWYAYLLVELAGTLPGAVIVMPYWRYSSKHALRRGAVRRSIALVKIIAVISVLLATLMMLYAALFAVQLAN